MSCRVGLLFLIAATAASCGGEKEVQATSFLGEPLYAAVPGAGALEKHEEARLAFEKQPDDVELAIWYGRRIAYLGRYGEAIELYTRGIESWPEDARLYRHRGHRYISTRRLDLAIGDFEKAAALIEGTEDEIEPDGMPNERGIPVSSLHTNTWYHLGLARYLKADYRGAVAAYRRNLEASRGPDNLVSTTHWLYLALRRLGREEEAGLALEPIAAEMDIIENTAYHRLCLFYRGELDEAALTGTEESAVMNAATAYGLGSWHLAEGRTERAREVFGQLLAQGQWAAFGHIAAEADLARGLE